MSKKLLLLRSILAASAVVNLFAACLPEPKTGCRTKDDCSPGRACAGGTCRPTVADTGLDANSDLQSPANGAEEVPEVASPDFTGDARLGSDSVVPATDVADAGYASVEGSDSSVLPDAGSFEAQRAEDLAADSLVGAFGLVVDLNSEVADFPPDAPATIANDASDFLEGLEASADSRSNIDVHNDAVEVSNPDLMPDLPPAVFDLATAPPLLPTTDAAPDGVGDLAPTVVSWEDFRSRSPREHWAGGRYIVDGDLAFDEAGLQSYYNAWFSAQGASPASLAPMGATVQWPFPNSMSLSYCISTDFGDNLSIVEAAMQVASTSWSARAGVYFTYVPAEDASCDDGNPNVTFDVRPVSGAGYAAVSFFPDSPRSARSILVDASAFVIGPGGVDLEATLRHQLGHTLGFRHEYLWLDPACTSEDSHLAVRVANYDIDTVMHLPACRPSENGGKTQTEGDLVGAVVIYGLSAALIVVSTM